MTCEVCGTALKRPFVLHPKPGHLRAWYCPHCTGKRASAAQQQAREKRRVERVIERKQK